MVVLPATAEPAAASVHPAPVRAITAADLRWALREGWSDFRQKRGELVILGFIYPVVGLVAALIAADINLFHELFPLVAGLSLLGPAVAAGFYEIARRRDRGEDPHWTVFFEPFRGPARGGIAALSLVSAAIFLAWMGAAWAVYEATVGRLAPATVGEFVRATFATPEGWTMIVIGNLVGLVFAAVALTLSVVSYPMALDKPGRPVAALATSVAATAKNPGTIALWGLTVAAILFVASIPIFTGLAIALPVLGYATWRLYTRLVER